MTINFKEIEFKIKQPSGNQQIHQIDDDFFKLSSGDAKQSILLMQQLQLTQQKQTQKSNNQERIQKLMNYPKTTIKFKFPNGMELTRIFKPTETVEDLFNFMRQILKAEKFFLRRPVGKNNWLIEDDTPLYQSNLVPSGVLLVVFYIKEDKIPPYLKEDILKEYEQYENELKTSQE